MINFFKSLKYKAGGFARGMASRVLAILARQRAVYVLRAAVVFFVSVLLLNLALGLSSLTRTEKFVGPFAVETQGSNALVVHLNNASKLRRLLSTDGDSPSNPYSSSLSITLNGVPLGPAHTLHDKIRNEKTAGGAYSHWDNQLIFSLPGTLNNSGNVELLVEYPISLSNGLLGGSNKLLAICLLFLGLRKHMLDRVGFASLAATWLNSFFMVSRAVWLFLFGVALTFLATIAYGFFDGYYLPSTAVFSYFPWVEQLAWLEPSVPYVILSYATLGVILAWMTSLSDRAVQDFYQQEQRFVALFNRLGLVFVLGFFLFSVAGTWAGIPRPQDLSGNAIGGLIPFSDAHGHFGETFTQIINGHWGSFASRRPFAAALRGAGMFLTGYSNALFLGMQTVLLALATFFASRAVMRWRGLWSGLTFLGLTMILVLPYLPTNLTEPIGILLALISIPYLVRAISGGSTATKSVGLLFTCWALIVRMGNMFFIPALGIWIFLSSEKTYRARRNAVLAVLVSIGFIFAFNAALSKLYGSEQGAVGGNFAHTFCGLAHNGNWTRCGELYADELNALGGDEASQAKLYYRRGLEKLASEPSLFIERVGSGAWHFLLNVPSILLKGYTGSIPNFFPVLLWFVVSIFGLHRLVKKGMPKNEKTFWGLFVLSLVGSASIVFFDDGVRVLCASFPLLALLFASGFSTPANHTHALPAADTQLKTMSQIGLLLIVMISLACLILPWAAYRLDVVQGRILKQVVKGPGEEVFFASRHMAGFLVVPDGVDLPKGVPAMSLKAFTQIIINSNVEQYEKLPTPGLLSASFGVVLAPGMTANGASLLIVPPKVLLDHAALGWIMTLSSGGYWRHVLRAEPIKNLDATVH